MKQQRRTGSCFCFTHTDFVKLLWWNLFPKKKKKCYSSENKFWEKLYPRYILIQLWHMIYIFDNYRYIWQWKHFQQHGNRTYLNCYLMTSIKNWNKILKANFAHRKGNNLNSKKPKDYYWRLSFLFSIFLNFMKTRPSLWQRFDRDHSRL